MFNISPLEVIVLLVIALVVLGPQRLPEMARSLGRGMRERAQGIDATFTVRSAPGEGTTVEVILPNAAPEPPRARRS